MGAYGVAVLNFFHPVFQEFKFLHGVLQYHLAWQYAVFHPFS